jgi:hypothetical protein
MAASTNVLAVVGLVRAAIPFAFQTFIKFRRHLAASDPKNSEPRALRLCNRL